MVWLPGKLVSGRRPAGRGVHLHVRQECLQQAVKKGLSRSMRRQVRMSSDELATTIRAHLAQALTRALGAARRQKALSFPPIGETALILRALDASPAPSYLPAGQVIAGTKEQLGHLVAQPEAEVLGILHRGLATRVRGICELANGAGIGGLEVG
ncbi:MAG: hypothetical protein RMJ98_10170 [Myxococcales bacterium]|nr:hypothetical protein [Polyangiaceae bacterium]MDW8249654.1 hypothetical protein [Myxococcales bacterium]